MLEPSRQALNQLPVADARSILMTVCSATAWVNGMLSLRPFADQQALLAASRAVWATTGESDWLQAFSGHAKIGDRRALSASSKTSTIREQGQVRSSSEALRTELDRLNQLYEAKFGFIFIICATGKSPEAMLEVLEAALGADRRSELHRAAREQENIMALRLGAWQS